MTETEIIYGLLAFVIFLQFRVLSELFKVKEFQIKSDENIHHSFELLGVEYFKWTHKNYKDKEK